MGAAAAVLYLVVWGRMRNGFPRLRLPTGVVWILSMIGSSCQRKVDSCVERHLG